MATGSFPGRKNQAMFSCPTDYTNRPAACLYNNIKCYLAARFSTTDVGRGEFQACNSFCLLWSINGMIRSEGIVDGDIFTYRSLYDLYYEKLCNYAYIYVCDTYDAENIVSDVFLNVWERRRTLGDVKNINSYLYAAVRNRAINHLKRYSFNRELQFSKMENNPLNSVADDVTSLPLECLMASELEKRIHGFIESLPPQTKMVMNLKRNENKTYEEIAELLDISVNTVKYHIKRALRLLRGELNDYM